MRTTQNPSTKASKPDSRLTIAKARAAARAAKKQRSTPTSKLPIAWQKGGTEYERLLGRFGPQSKLRENEGEALP